MFIFVHHPSDSQVVLLENVSHLFDDCVGVAFEVPLDTTMSLLVVNSRDYTDIL